MTTSDKIASKLFDTIDDSVDELMASIPAIEKKMLRDITAMVSTMRTSNGAIVTSVENLRKVQQIRRQIERNIINKSYVRNVSKFTNTINEVDALQQAYFSSMVDDFKYPTVLNAVKETAIKNTAANLLESGVRQEVSNNIAQLLQSSVASKSSVSDIFSELATFINGDTQRKGVLGRWVHQVATDSMYQYAAEYNAIISDSIGMKWFKYVGGRKDTSRSFCVNLLLKKYVHESEFDDIAKGDFSPKPANLDGLIKGTDGNNLRIRRGGYNCGHQFMPISEELVPDSVKTKLGKKEEDVDFDEEIKLNVNPQKLRVRGTTMNKLHFSEIEDYLADKDLNVNAIFDMIADDKQMVYVSNGFLKGLAKVNNEPGEWHHFFKKDDDGGFIAGKLQFK